MKWLETPDRLINREEIAALQFHDNGDDAKGALKITLKSGVEIQLTGLQATEIWNEYKKEAVAY